MKTEVQWPQALQGVQSSSTGTVMLSTSHMVLLVPEIKDTRQYCMQSHGHLSLLGMNVFETSTYVQHLA